MRLETFAAGLPVLLVSIGVFWAWRSRLAASASGIIYTDHKWSTISWIILGAYFFIPVFFFERRFDLSTLYLEGARG